MEVEEPYVMIKYIPCEIIAYNMSSTHDLCELDTHHCFLYAMYLRCSSFTFILLTYVIELNKLLLKEDNLLG